MSDLTIYENGVYLENNPLWHVEESSWKVCQVMRMLNRHSLRPRTISDVGCGAGEVLRQLQSQMDPECLFCGYEISPQAFELCLSRANDRLQFKLLNIRQEKGVLFDLILVLDVIEHLEDYFSFLRDIKPKSQYKIFHIPLDASVQTLLRPNGLLKRRNLYAHLHYFTKETALSTLEDVGYEVLDWCYTPRSIEFATAPMEKILKFPRKFFFALQHDLSVRVLGGFSLLALAR